MIEVLYCSYITDESNEAPGIDLTRFSQSHCLTLIFTAHQGGASPSTSGVKAELQHSNNNDGTGYDPVPNAVLLVSGPGSQASSIVEIEPAVLRPYGKVVLVGVGEGDPAGAGSVTAVW